ncbi:MAG: T9SS type A sorting domain-containing protein [Paludibacter sp.]|nr:T9SS type A sorting domain-containing protein [Paludibacter sp.]
MKTIINIFLICLTLLFCSTLSAQTNLLDNETEDAGFEGITTSKIWPPNGTWGRSGYGSINASTTVRTQMLSDSIIANPGTQPIIWRSKYSYLFLYMRGSNTPTNYIWRKISGLTSGQTYTFSFWYKTPIITAFTPTGHVKFAIVTDLNDVQVGSITNPLNGITEIGHIEGDGVSLISSYLQHKLVKKTFIVPSGKTEIYVALVRSLDSEQLLYIDDMSLVVGQQTGINDIKSAKNLTVYPNPTSKYLYFNDNSSTLNKISILNLQGKTVKTINNTSNKLDVGDLSNGMYILKNVANDGVSTCTFIKE